MQDLNQLQAGLRQFAKDIPASAGVSIEYNIPLTNRRVDFILTGKDANRQDTAVIVELKQWQEAQVTSKDAIVKTRFQHGEQETNHPSYQAWSYAALIQDYNQTVRDEAITLQPCAYLHNMKSEQGENTPMVQRCNAGIGGINEIINEDPLGQDTIYSPTKRYTAKTVDYSVKPH